MAREVHASTRWEVQSSFYYIGKITEVNEKHKLQTSCKWTLAAWLLKFLVYLFFCFLFFLRFIRNLWSSFNEVSFFVPAFSCS